MRQIVFILATILLAVSANACEEFNRVYEQSYIANAFTNAVYICSTSGKPNITKRHWICRTDLSEGDETVVTYLPLCPGAKSEYQQLTERKSEVAK